MAAGMKTPEQIIGDGEATRSSLDVPCGSNAIHYQKPPYTTFVEHQIEITGMSYQDYYARFKQEIETMMAKDPDMKFLLPLGLHKADKRAIDAIRTRGQNWRDSDKLREDDKHYVHIAQENLEVLKGLGISLDKDPDQVLRTIKDTFGKIGQEIVAKSRRMPIYGEVFYKKEDLQCGDRYLNKEYENNSIRALREGEVAATAILYLTTLMTFNGVCDPRSKYENPDDFIKASVELGNEAFSASDDWPGLKARGMSDEEIEEEKAAGNFAQGSAGVTNVRHTNTPDYYVLLEQVACTVALYLDHQKITQGKAPKGGVTVRGSLSITQEQSEIERGVNQPMTVTLYTETPEGRVIAHSEETKTDRDGDFSVTFSEETVNGLDTGKWLVSANFSGPIRGEDLDCGNEAPLVVEKQPSPKAVEKQPSPKAIVAPEKEPREVYVRRWSPSLTMISASATTEEKKQLGLTQPIPNEVWDYDPEEFPALGKISSPACHDDIRVIKEYVSKKEVQEDIVQGGVKNAYKGFGIHFTYKAVVVEKEQEVNIDVIRHPWNYGDNEVDNETVEEHQRKTISLQPTRETKTSVGFEIGYGKKFYDREKFRADFDVQLGLMTGAESRWLYGLEVAISNKDKTTGFCIGLTNELYNQASLTLSATKAIVGGLSGSILFAAQESKKPLLGVQVSHSFR